MPNKRISPDQRLQIIARVARGDTYASIGDDFGITAQSVAAIKMKNKQVLEIIQAKLIDHQVSMSSKLLSKSQQLIERKLDKAMKSDAQRDKLFEMYQNEEIDYQEYRARMDKIFDVTIAELNAVSRESFNQSQLEQNKPTAISNTSQSDSRQQLVDLVEAIKGGDEVQLFKMVLNSNGSNKEDKL